MADEKREEDIGEDGRAWKEQRGEEHGRVRCWSRVPVTDKQKGGMGDKASQEIPKESSSAVLLLASLLIRV